MNMGKFFGLLGRLKLVGGWGEKFLEVGEGEIGVY